MFSIPSSSLADAPPSKPKEQKALLAASSGTPDANISSV